MTAVFPGGLPSRLPTRSFQAFVAAVGLEALLVSGLIAWSLAQVPVPVPVKMQEAVPLNIELPPPAPLLKPPPAPQPMPPPAAKTVVPVPSITPKTAPPVADVLPRSTPVPTPPMATMAPATEPVAAAVATAPSVPNAPAAPAVPIQAAPSTAGSGIDPALAYNSKLAAAVQQVYQVPATATELEFRGRTRVEFSLRDGVVTNVKLVQSSGLGAADRAAIKAVQTAAFPLPPAELRGREGVYAIWVNCRL